MSSKSDGKSQNSRVFSMMHEAKRSYLRYPFVFLPFICCVVYLYCVAPAWQLYWNRFMQSWNTLYVQRNAHMYVKKQSGEHVLPPRALSALKILRSRPKLQEYALSGALLADDLNMQRITEGAWPRKRKKDSKDILLLVDEKASFLAQGCIEKAAYGDIVYVRCP